MDKLTDFDDTSDVSDAAIEWVLSHPANEKQYDWKQVRECCDEGFAEDRAIIIAARLIQQHRPDLLADPVDAIVREELAKQWPDIAEYFLKGDMDDANNYEVGKRLYLMGVEAGKNS